jgi:hypothetical protein
MLTASDLKGVLAMMPAFATPDAVDVRSTQTIAVDNLKEGVDKYQRRGEQYRHHGNLRRVLQLAVRQFKTLAVATVEAKRVPLFMAAPA